MKTKECQKALNKCVRSGDKDRKCCLWPHLKCAKVQQLLKDCDTQTTKYLPLKYLAENYLEIILDSSFLLEVSFIYLHFLNLASKNICPLSFTSLFLSSSSLTGTVLKCMFASILTLLQPVQQSSQMHFKIKNQPPAYS